MVLASLVCLTLQQGTTLGNVRAMVPPDLRPPAMPTAAQNGWQLMVKASGRSSPRPPLQDTRSVSDFLSKWRKEKPDRKDIPAALRAVKPFDLRISQLQAALARPVWASPRRPNPDHPSLEPADVDFPADAGMKELAKVLCLRAWVHALQGKGSFAVADIALARQMGSRLAAGNSEFIHYLVGVAIEAIADDAALRIACTEGMSDQNLTALQRVVAARPEVDRLANTLRVEFDTRVLVLAAALPDDPKKLVPTSWVPALAGQRIFDRKDTVNRLAFPFLAALGNRSRPWSKQVDVEALTRRESPKPPVGEGPLNPSQVRQLKQWLSRHPNLIGRQLAEITASYAQKAEETERKALSRQRLTVTAIALHRRKLKTGRRPVSLGALSIADPFGNGPILYNATAGRLWSVGPDGKNDGGKGKPNGIKPDMVIMLP